MSTPREEPATLDGSVRDGWDGWAARVRGGAGDRREPRLRLLYHSDLARLGAISLPESLPRDGWLTLGRGIPNFALLGRYGPNQPIEDPQVSREQVRLRWLSEAQMFEVEPVASARRPVVRVDLGPRDSRDAAAGNLTVSPITGPTLLPPGSCIAIGDRILLGLELAETRPPRADRMGLVGETDAMWTLREEARSVAKFGRPALVHGPTGAGKELVARALHLHGPNPTRPFVPVNCAALPEQLVESVLFGHRRGAFTGANTDERGLFRAADGGTLFLDELGELPLSVQPKLLRVLQDGVVIPVGGHEERKVDVRVVAATHRDATALVRSGGLREDLYHRICAHMLEVPPLAERRFDVPELFVHALRRLRAVHASLEWLFTSGERWRPAIPIGFIADLLRYTFPGNVRELENLAERTARLNLDPGTFRSPDAPGVLDTGAPAHARQSDRPPASIPPNAASDPQIEIAQGPPTVRDERVPETVVRAAADALGLAHKTVLKLLPPAALATFASDSEGERRSDRADAAREARTSRLRATATDALVALLEAHDYNQTEVANTLGTSRTTLIKLMDDLGLPRGAELTQEEIARARADAGGDLTAAARILRVSAGALKRRIAVLMAKTKG